MDGNNYYDIIIMIEKHSEKDKLRSKVHEHQLIMIIKNKYEWHGNN